MIAVDKISSVWDYLGVSASGVSAFYFVHCE